MSEKPQEDLSKYSDEKKKKKVGDDDESTNK